MSIRDLFRLMMKLFGLYILISNLFSLPYYLGFFFYNDLNWLHVLGSVALGLAMISFFLYLAFRPDPIIKLLRLEQGFEQNQISLDRIDPTSLTRIGVLVVGGFFFLRNVGSALTNLYLLFRSSVASAYDRESMISTSEPIDLAINLLTIIISWLLITNALSVARFLTPAKPVMPDDPVTTDESTS